MTANPDTPTTPLGVGSLISESFGVFFARIVTMFKIIFLPILVMGAISAMVSGPAMITGIGTITGDVDPEQLARFSNPGVFEQYILPLIGVVVSFVITGAVILAAYDTKLGRPVNIPAYFSRTLAFLVPLIVLSIVLVIMGYIGLLLLILPGIYIFARFSVLTPAIVVEGVGWGGLGRAQELTAGYRWPIVGASILLVLAIIVISLVIAGLTWLGYTIAGIVGYTLVYAIGNTITTGIMGCFTALLFARLKEIKEGVGMADIASVFE